MRIVTDPWSKMALNNAWANATLYDAMSGMNEATFTARRPGFFNSLAATMNHIYEVDLYYLDALEDGGRGLSVYEREEINDPNRLAKLQADADLRFATFCKSLSQDDLDASHKTERKNGVENETTAALILHLVQHQIHHRGQAHVQLHDAGIAPPQLDDFYLEFGRVPSAAAYW